MTKIDFERFISVYKSWNSVATGFVVGYDTVKDRFVCISFDDIKKHEHILFVCSQIDSSKIRGVLVYYIKKMRKERYYSLFR